MGAIQVERFSDYCYKCGIIDQVTGICNLNKAATIITPNGILARLYGPWIRADHKGSMDFINKPNLKRR